MYYLLHDKARLCDYVVAKFFSFLPDKLYLSLRYRCCMGHWMNWKHPKTFNEKLQWLKLNDCKPEYTQMVDKFAAKNYVAERIGNKYIIPTLAVWDKVEDIDWNVLPDQFVLKTTHGGGSGGVVICTEKSKLDKEKAIRKLKISMQKNAGYTYREKPYLKVPRKIIAEKFMEEHDAANLPIRTDLIDYKFFCFNGEPKFLYISDSPKHELVFLNTDWSVAPFKRKDYEPMKITPPRPNNLDEMLEVARRLSKGIPHVRVDLYNINHHIYFGELTFYTCGGLIPFTSEEYDRLIGDMLLLSLEE